MDGNFAAEDIVNWCIVCFDYFAYFDYVGGVGSVDCFGYSADYAECSVDCAGYFVDCFDYFAGCSACVMDIEFVDQL